MRKTIHDKWAAENLKAVDALKKVATTYKTNADAIENGVKKLEVEMNGIDDQIRKLVQNYQQTAIKMDNEEVADAVRGLLGFMP